MRRLLATLVSGFNADGTPFTLPTTTTPDAANILNGRQSFGVTTTAVTLITVPAGRTWSGTVGASASCANAASTTVAARAVATFSTSGAGVTPAAGIHFTIVARAGANAATGTVGTQDSTFGSIPFTVVAPVDNSVTIEVASTNTGTYTNVDTFAVGQLL